MLTWAIHFRIVSKPVPFKFSCHVRYSHFRIISPRVWGGDSDYIIFGLHHFPPHIAKYWHFYSYYIPFWIISSLLKIPVPPWNGI